MTEDRDRILRLVDLAIEFGEKPPEMRYSDDQPRDPNGKWSSGGSLEDAHDIISKTKTGDSFTATLHRGEGTDPKEAAKNRIPSQYAVGEHWTPDKDVAESYGPKVRTEEITLVNPYVLELKNKLPYYEELKKTFGSMRPEVITDKLKADGHDGMIVKNVPVMRQGANTLRTTEVIKFRHEAADRQVAVRQVGAAMNDGDRVLRLIDLAVEMKLPPPEGRSFNPDQPRDPDGFIDEPGTDPSYGYMIREPRST